MLYCYATGLFGKPAEGQDGLKKGTAVSGQQGSVGISLRGAG